MARRRTLPRVPRETDDVRNTIKRQLIEIHFEGLGSELDWDVVRLKQLAAMLGVTVYELGAMVRCTVSEVERWLQRDRIPKPVELHLTFIERAALRTPAKTPLLPIDLL